jgi:hypothetical protein
MAALALAEPQEAQSFKLGAPVNWTLAKPIRLGIDGLFPERAQRNGQDGKASLICELGSATTLKSCGLLTEEPKTWGFSEATIRAAGSVTLDPTQNLAPGSYVWVQGVFKAGPTMESAHLNLTVRRAEAIPASSEAPTPAN